jgi:hypothetical protein
MSYQSHHFIQFATYFPIYWQPAIVLGGWNLGIPLSPDICLLFILMSCRVLLRPYPTLLYAPATTPAQARCLLRNCYDRYPILAPHTNPHYIYCCHKRFPNPNPSCQSLAQQMEPLSLLTGHLLPLPVTPQTGRHTFIHCLVFSICHFYLGYLSSFHTL